MRCLFYTAGRILFAHILTGFVLANSNPLEVLRPRTD
jgi:hypothetical protein